MTAQIGKCRELVGDRRYEEKLDWIMGLLTVVGAAVGVLVPFVLIILSTVFFLPHLGWSIMVCQVMGVAMVIIGLGYFVCQKDI
jgi:hypothetical protein